MSREKLEGSRKNVSVIIDNQFEGRVMFIRICGNCLDWWCDWSTWQLNRFAKDYNSICEERDYQNYGNTQTLLFNKQLLDEVFVITLTETLIVLDITKTESNDCLSIHIVIQVLEMRRKYSLMSRIERKFCLISTSYLAELFDIFILLYIWQNWVCFGDF